MLCKYIIQLKSGKRKRKEKRKNKYSYSKVQLRLSKNFELSRSALYFDTKSHSEHLVGNQVHKQYFFETSVCAN